MFVEGCRFGSSVMEKHKLLVTFLCIYLCIYAYRVHGTLKVAYKESFQNYKTQNKLPDHKLKSKGYNYNTNGEIYDKVTDEDLTSYIQNGHLRDVKSSQNQLIFHNPVHENRPSDAFKGGTLPQKTYMPDADESTNRRTIVHFKSISRQENKLNSDVSSPRSQWRFNKPGTILLGRHNYIAVLTEREVLQQHKKKLQAVFSETGLHRDNLKENSDNDVSHHLRLSQRRNQYPKFVRRVRKSVNEVQNGSINTSRASDNSVSQQLPTVVPIQNTNTSDVTRSASEGLKLDQNNSKSGQRSDLVKGDNVLWSGGTTTISGAPETSASQDATDFVKMTNGIEMATLRSTSITNMDSKMTDSTSTDANKPYIASTVNDDSVAPVQIRTSEKLSSGNTTVNPLLSDEQSKATTTSAVGAKTVVTMLVHSPPTSEHGAHTSTSNPNDITNSVQQVQTGVIPELLIQNLTQSVTFTTKNTETPKTSQTAQTTEIFQQSTVNNESKVEVTSPQPATETTSEATTSQTSSPSSSSQSSSSPEPVPETSPEFTNKNDVFTGKTLSASVAVTERSTSTTVNDISSEHQQTRENTSPGAATSTESVFEDGSLGTTVSGGGGPEPATTVASQSVSVSISSTTSVSAELVTTAVSEVTATTPTKQSTHTTGLVTLATEPNPKQNDTIATTVTMKTSTFRVLPNTTRYVETTHTSKADGTPSSEPTTAPETTPEPKPEPKNPYGTSEPSPGVAEPGPDWEEARKKWRYAWPAHLYLFGGVFALLAVFIVACMIQLWQINHLLSRRYFFTLNLLIFYFCALRAFYLLFDGYNSNGAFPDVLQYFLYSSGFPCLTSSFSILLFSLLTATQMQLVPPKIQKVKYLIVIILFHFIVQISSDIIAGLSSGARMMLFVCQLLYIVWGLCLFCGYAFIFKRLYYSAVKRQKTFQYVTAGKHYLDESKSERKRFTLSLAVKVTLLAAVFGLVTIVLEVYSIVNVYGILSDKQPDAWAWWIYHTALRLTECFMCLTMSYIASQPFRYSQKYTRCICYVLCAPCVEMCSCNHSGVNDSLGWDNDRVDLNMMSASQTNGQMNGKKKVRLNETADIVPAPVHPNSGELSRPTSLLIIEDGYVRFQTDNDINKIVDSYTGGPKQEMLTFKSGDGIINGAYLILDDPLTVDRASSHGYARKSSLASSEVFHPPSSLSLADSMDMEIDKALRNLHDTKNNTDVASSGGTVTKRISDSVKRPTIEAYLEEQAAHPLPTLRRSRSALGDISEERRESWRQKLFRSRSDNSRCITTKDLENQKYFSLLDLERWQNMDEHLKVGKSVSGQYSSDDMFLGNTQTGDHSLDNGAARRLLTSSSESDEIEV